MNTTPRFLLASDLDGTLLPLPGNTQNRHDLRTLLDHVQAGRLDLMLVTGRDRESMLGACRQHEIAPPPVVICDGGTSIVTFDRSTDNVDASDAAPNGTLGQYVDAYRDELELRFGPFDPQACAQRLASMSSLRLRDAVKQNRFKVSYFCEAKRLDQCVDEVKSRLSQGLGDCHVLGGQSIELGQGLIDIMPLGLSKAFALRWWIERQGIARQRIVYCGDGGNDLDVFLDGYRNIVVGNAERRIAWQVYQQVHASGQSAPSIRQRLYFSQAPATSGVLEGVHWLQLIDAQTVSPDQTNLVGEDDSLAAEDDLPLGAVPIGCNTTSFNVWAPRAKSLAVKLTHLSENEQPGCETPVPDRVELTRHDEGYFRGQIQPMGAGDRYHLLIDDRIERPDPVSRWQPDGVHGASQVIDHRQYPWQDQSYTGVAKQDLVIYELHIGTFTSAGTLVAAIDRLPELARLGITAVELMPLAQCPGKRNWGYDGVNLFAPSNNYGTPDELKQWVDACHALGIAVIVDVVYNHLGPEGNYLNDFAPYFSRKHRTPWGDALGYDGRHCKHVRRFVIENALSWLRDFHCDGLRLDAVHFMFDDSPESILLSIRKAVNEFASGLGRPIHLIAEANIYDHELVSPNESCHAYDAIWADDLMHSIYSHAVPGINLAHRHYAGASDVEESLRHGFIYTGPQLDRITAQRRSELYAPDQLHYLESFVCALQTHDSVGNHARGRRFHHLTSPAIQRSAAALILLYPSIPMIFMGEEHSCEQGFMFFVDFGDRNLQRAVDRGRRREYSAQQWEGAIRPSRIEAFEQSRSLGIDDPGMWDWYQKLLSLRRQWRTDGLLHWKNLHVDCRIDQSVFSIGYRNAQGQAVFVLSRFAAKDQSLPPLTITTGGDVLIETGCEQITSGTHRLHDAATLIGTGHWQIEA